MPFFRSMQVKHTLMERMLHMVGTRPERPPPPPPDAYRVLPWGAIDSLANQPREETPAPSPAPAPQPVLDAVSRTADGRPRFALLALSGGGSRGAFGAGLLSGWTRSGNRPQFTAVTGISGNGRVGPR